MTRRIFLVGSVGLLFFSLLSGFFPSLGNQEALAQRGPRQVRASDAVGLGDIEGLNSLDLRFGASQNSLVLTLGDTSSSTIIFGLNGVTPTSSRTRGGLAGVAASFEYRTDLPTNIAYNLSRGESRPSFCSEQPRISLSFDPAAAPSTVNGYSQLWRTLSLSGRSLNATIWLPLLNSATSLQDDCLLLEAALSFNAGSVPLFTLTGDQSFEESCAGLQIYGRGGDDLEKAKTRWICYDDADLVDETRDKFAQIDSPPFARSYIFIEIREDKCGSRLLVDADQVDEGLDELTGQWQDFHDDCKKGQYDEDKSAKKVVTLALANGSDLVRRTEAGGDETILIPAVEGDGVNNADTGLLQGAPLAGSSTGGTCEFNLGGLGFGWIFCWIFKGISESLYFVEERIEGYLTLEEGDYKQQFATGGGEFTFKDAWRNVRNLMTFAIVATALFMVISTALDVGVFKNYTVKKYLPRLVAGSILIQFSWALGDLLIQATNLSGDLLEALLFAALPEARGFGLNDILDGGFYTFVAGAGAGLYLRRYWMMLLGVGVTALGAFLVGFLFLVARKYLIIFCLILAPLGLALWILPGNDKAWRFYAKSFLYLLLFYPIIKLTISTGRIFAYLILL